MQNKTGKERGRSYYKSTKRNQAGFPIETEVMLMKKVLLEY
jgi:hypothetical protein